MKLGYIALLAGPLLLPLLGQAPDDPFADPPEDNDEVVLTREEINAANVRGQLFRSVKGQYEWKLAHERVEIVTIESRTQLQGADGTVILELEFPNQIGDLVASPNQRHLLIKVVWQDAAGRRYYRHLLRLSALSNGEVVTTRLLPSTLDWGPVEGDVHIGTLGALSDSGKRAIIECRRQLRDEETNLVRYVPSIELWDLERGSPAEGGLRIPAVP